LIFDIAALDAGTGYLDVGVSLVSPDEDLLAFSVDTAGDEVFELRFRDLRTGADLPDRLPRSYYGGAWSADSQWFFYTVHDEAYRAFQVWRHRLGTDPADDVLVLDEPDQRFELNVRLARSEQVIVIWTESRSTSEAWVVDAATPEAPPRSVGGRRHGVTYHVEHAPYAAGGGRGDRLLVVTDDDAVEFRLMTAPVPRDADQDQTAWQEARPERAEERLIRADAFAGGVVLAFRAEGEHRLRVVAHDDLAGAGHVVRSAYDVGFLDLAHNALYDVGAVNVCDESYLRPPLWSSLDLATAAITEVHRAEAPGHDPDRYAVERRTFPAPDGTAVTAVLLRRRETPLDGTAPALVYGYGAYEAVDEAEWDTALPSLLDRGVVWVHALIRGGGDGGRRWWLDGSLRHKQHTFDDLAAVADGLERDGLVDGQRIATRGLSAGGLLQGVVFSQRPERWRAVVAEVPFVDVVTTMFDESIPLTITEWEEWGDPRVREEFDWMLAYSPYDNLPAAGSRPDLLVTGAVHDPRVMVREPAKWVAALRHSDPAWSPRLLFRCETGAGAHVGPSGRVGHLGYEAEIYAYVLDRLGATDE
jgi:oligopeptidase B